MLVNRVDLFDFYRKRLSEYPFRRVALLAFRFLWNARSLRHLLIAAPHTNLGRLVKCRPEIFYVLATRFVAVDWNVASRVSRLIDHCKIVEAIGSLVNFHPDAVCDLMRLAGINSRYRLTLDQARWQLREGPLVMSLWDDEDRIYSLSFCFASEGSRRIVYVGGIQGVRQTNILDRYRSFTRSASGMRPRDFLIEVFRTFCRVLNVKEIRAVSSANHITNSQGFTEATEINDDIKLSYDEVWKARGGVYDGKSFFVLATDVRRRPIQELPAKKRPIYRKRYLMLDQVDAQLVHVMRSRCNLAHSVGLKTEWTDASGCLPKLADAK